ncbi:MAG: hypothetical protein JNN30_10415 [Rhodanobacteraceae bacterium]|nr:hypothetical protein [Rhodanobacteraceae bacterium]
MTATTCKPILPVFTILLSPLAVTLSWLAIVMPVLAVAAMSISANLKKKARTSTYRNVKSFLMRQRERLSAAETEPEFRRLQAEPEIKLPNETLHRYYHRRFANAA